MSLSNPPAAHRAVPSSLPETGVVPAELAAVVVWPATAVVGAVAAVAAFVLPRCHRQAVRVTSPTAGDVVEGPFPQPAYQRVVPAPKDGSTRQFLVPKQQAATKREREVQVKKISPISMLPAAFAVFSLEQAHRYAFSKN